MSEIKEETKAIGEFVILHTESCSPLWFKYHIQTIGFHVIKLTLDFEGSTNFEVLGDGKLDDSSLKALLISGPNKKSPIVTLKQVDPKKGGTLSLGISYTVERPPLDESKAYAAESEHKLVNVINQAKQFFPPEIIDASTVEDIVEHCTALNTSFVDLNFPPLVKSLYDGSNDTKRTGTESLLDPSTNTPIVWRRCVEFMKNNHEIRVFKGKIEPNDIKQGQLGDCWLMCALSSIAEFPSLVEYLFVTKEANSQGVYKLRLCKNGMWSEILLDDHFPCYPEEGPIYSRANNEELWVLLLEKAFAKAHGSYAMLRSGWPFEAMIDLTGAPYREIRFNDADAQKEIQSGELFNYLIECDHNGYIMSLSTGGEDTFTEGGGDRNRVTGLIPGHAYTLISVVETSQGHKLLKIRNPWGGTEWNGDWGDNSSLWTPQLKREVNFEAVDDGTFWMCFEDMVQNFYGLNVCASRHAHPQPWLVARHPYTYVFSPVGRGVVDCGMYLLTIEHPETEVYISVHQKDKRNIDAIPYIDIGVSLLQSTADPTKFHYIASSGNSTERQNQLHIPKLSPGKYYLIPTSSGAKMEQYRQEASEKNQTIDLTRTCVIVVHASHSYGLDEITFDPLAYEEAMELPIIHGQGNKIQKLFGDDSAYLYTRKSGYGGISYVARNNLKNQGLQIELDCSKSRNVVTSRRSLKAKTIIPPMEAKVLHHLMPQDDDQSWSAGWSCKAVWLNINEMQALIEEENELNIN